MHDYCLDKIEYTPLSGQVILGDAKYEALGELSDRWLESLGCEEDSVMWVIPEWMAARLLKDPRFADDVHAPLAGDERWWLESSGVEVWLKYYTRWPGPMSAPAMTGTDGRG